MTVIVAWAGPPAPAPAAETPSIAAVPAGIQRLLDARGRAYERHDRELLAGTLTGRVFTARQLAALDAAAPLTFSRYSFRASTQFTGDIAGARVRALYPDKQVAAYHVVEENTIRDYDLQPYVEDDFFTFVRDREQPDDPYGGWRLASGSDFEVLGGFSAYHPWDSGLVATASSEHFLLLSHPDQIARVRPALDIAEAAYAKVARFWPRPIGARYVIIAPSNAEELGKLIAATIDLGKFVAFAASTERREEGWAPGGVRLFVQLSRFERYDAAGKEVVLAHELIHAVTRPVSGPFFPSWLEEGVAMYGAEPLQLAPARPGEHDRFPTDDQFFVGPTAGIVGVYYQSQVAVAVLAQRYQVSGLATMYETLGRARVAAGTDDYQVREAVKSSLGWTVEGWTEAWRRRLR